MKDDSTLINEVLAKFPNKYMAVIVASKRARAINDGQRPLVKTGASKSTTIALAEIAEGVIVLAEATEIEAAKKAAVPDVPELKMPEIEAESAEKKEKEAEEEKNEEEEKQLPPPSDSPETDEQDKEDKKEDKEE